MSGREAVVPDRHAFFDARWVRQKVVRFIGIGVPPWHPPEFPVGAPDQSNDSRHFALTLSNAGSVADPFEKQRSRLSSLATHSISRLQNDSMKPSLV